MKYEFKGKTVLVVGTGVSGIASYDLLKKMRANPVLFDGNKDLKIEEVKNSTIDGSRAKVYAGEIPEDIFESISLAVLSPGVPTDTGFALTLKEKNIPFIGEIELAYQAAKGKLLAITGTNGKTTTTALCGAIAADYFEQTFVVGNIGIPYTSVALEMKKESVTVAEISSFQLETISEFHPNVSAILNITPDHLNRHHTMDNYIAAKKAICMNQTKEDVCVLNAEDPVLAEFVKDCPATVLLFSSGKEVANGCFLKEDDIYFAQDGKSIKLMNIHDMLLLGTHNVENVMAAICITFSVGIPLASIVNTVKTFRAVEHRIEFVTTKKGVDYYNDSKGTNPDAAIKGVMAMNRPTVLIGGGYDKESTYDEWIQCFDRRVKALVLIGQTAEKIEACARKHGFMNIHRADSLEEAVAICARLAKSGDAVLLSPACASWGMFPNYEVRGRIFKDLVHKLED
ncbi:MAG: UDP-N-acetylmuramoyl-L-alanine--D-glutamate ligase [Lachnospiraceae bacterium]|nr:UDP-N-acetylmuramoyl-L-alanine--D-glutamate ligase [Lachnospiraceae bacterium]